MQIIKLLFLPAILLIFSQMLYAQAKTPDKNLPNFAQVSENLYRGGQPAEEGIKNLARMGVKTIIDLRGEDERAKAEEKWARDAGINFINVNLSNWFKPKTADIEQIIREINAAGNQPVFVHCRRGADRTGTVIAVYRISHDNWTAKQAIAEAGNYKLGWWQLRMKDYINDYYDNSKKQK